MQNGRRSTLRVTVRHMIWWSTAVDTNKYSLNSSRVILIMGEETSLVNAAVCDSEKLTGIGHQARKRTQRLHSVGTDCIC